MKNASYFSHDSNARNDEKIIALRMKHDWKGYGLYWAIVEKLREATCYKLSCDYNLLAFELRVDAGLIKSIINDFGLFSFTDKSECFYSDSLCERMVLREAKSAQATEAINRRWELEKARKHTDVLRTNNGSNTSKESKEKKSIEDRAKAFHASCAEFTSTYPKQMLRSFYDYWTEKNPAGVKMKFELEKTFEVSKRLATWARRDEGFSKTPKQQNHTIYSLGN